MICVLLIGRDNSFYLACLGVETEMNQNYTDIEAQQWLDCMYSVNFFLGEFF